MGERIFRWSVTWDGGSGPRSGPSVRIVGLMMLGRVQGRAPPCRADVGARDGGRRAAPRFAGAGGDGRRDLGGAGVDDVLPPGPSVPRRRTLSREMGSDGRCHGSSEPAGMVDRTCGPYLGPRGGRAASSGPGWTMCSHRGRPCRLPDDGDQDGVERSAPRFVGAGGEVRGDLVGAGVDIVLPPGPSAPTRRSLRERSDRPVSAAVRPGRPACSRGPQWRPGWLVAPSVSPLPGWALVEPATSDRRFAPPTKPADRPRQP